MFHWKEQWWHRNVLLFHRLPRLPSSRWRSQPNLNKQLWSIHPSKDVPPLQLPAQRSCLLRLYCNRTDICQQGGKHMSEYCSSHTYQHQEPRGSQRCQHHREAWWTSKDLDKVCQLNRLNHKSRSHKREIPLPKLVCQFYLKWIQFLLPHRSYGIRHWTPSRWQLEMTA